MSFVMRRWVVTALAFTAVPWCVSCRSSGAAGDVARPVDAPLGSTAAKGPAAPAASEAAPPPSGFRDPRSAEVVGHGKPTHRGLDVLVAEGEPQRLSAKFAYGRLDHDLQGEDVIVEVEGAAKAWEPLGTYRTSSNGTDDGGRVTLVIPSERTRGVGRHRVRFTVVGDKTSTEVALVVVGKGQRAFVSDVDGTLTTSEWADVGDMLRGATPKAHDAAPRALGILAARGHLPIYLTARPERLVSRTRAFLEAAGFPPGVVIAAGGRTGAVGNAAVAAKRAVLEQLAARVEIAWAFGNMASDAEVYAAFVKDARRRVLFRLTDPTHGGRRIESYAEIVSELGP